MGALQVLLLHAAGAQRIDRISEWVQAAGYGVVAMPADGLNEQLALIAPPVALVIEPRSLPLDLTTAIDMLRRSAPHVLILVLAARASADDRLSAFAAGVDDFWVGRLTAREFQVRLQALVRRVPPQEHLSPLDIVIDERDRTGRVGSQVMHLTRKEFELLAVFMRHRGSVLSKEQLLDHVWGGAWRGHNAVEARVSSLRRKLGEAGQRIETVRGWGYRFR